MTNKNINFATLDENQLATIKHFEKEFNTKYDNQFFIMAFDSK